MKKKRFSVEQMIGVLKQAQVGVHLSWLVLVRRKLRTKACFFSTLNWS